MIILQKKNILVIIIATVTEVMAMIVITTIIHMIIADFCMFENGGNVSNVATQELLHSE